MKFFSMNASQPVAGAWSLPARLQVKKFRLPVPSPSLRVPVTRANRERLRALRAAEAQAWNGPSVADATGELSLPE
jgi:hypothetical protein